MKKNSNIFQDDIKVPEIVLQKADEAFAGIQTEGRSTMKKNNQTENRKHTFWRNPAAVAACTCIIVAGSVTAGRPSIMCGAAACREPCRRRS